MKLWASLLLLIIFFKANAQDKSLDGIVFDKATKDRIAEVNVLNTATGKSGYNNLKGEFIIDAGLGDVLIFTKQNYLADTVKVKSFTPLAVYMARSSIQLKEVDIHGEALNPEQQLAATKRDYTKIYGRLGDRDMLSLSPGAGVGISIDALYNTFSRSGRNAERLQGIIERDYYQSVVDYRFNQTFVSRVTGLKDAQLTDFMQKYRPGYYFVIAATDYELITSIKANLKRYLRRPKNFSIQSLPPNSKPVNK